jgi:hypothetical protein
MYRPIWISAASEPIVRFLAEKGADVDQQREHFELKPNAASAKSSQGSGSHSNGD